MGMPMLRVEFITTEDEQDLIVSFAIAPSAERSLTLLRSPMYEHLLPVEEQGITVGPLDLKEVEPDFLRSVQCSARASRSRPNDINTNSRFRQLPKARVARAKAGVRKMVEGGAARVDGA